MDGGNFPSLLLDNRVLNNGERIIQVQQIVLFHSQLNLVRVISLFPL